MKKEGEDFMVHLREDFLPVIIIQLVLKKVWAHRN